MAHRHKDHIDNPACEPLAIEGGPRTIAGDPPTWPQHDPAVRAALEGAWADGSWGRYHGPHGERLAAVLAERQQVAHALLCCSGTFAVELALRGLNVQNGDEVLLAGYDFPGNFRAIEAIGALPVLVDISPDNWALDLAGVSAAVGPKTRAILVSHLHGGLAAMPEFRELADQHGLAIVEDACQAPGADVAGRAAGSWGDVGVFSFGGSKLLTAGRGGAIVTPHADVYQRAKIYCERGNQAFPLSELQAAVLLPQWERLNRDNSQRRASVGRIMDLVADLPGLRRLVNRVEPAAPSFYKLGFHYEAAELGDCEIDRFVAAAQAEGVPLDRGFRGFVLRSGRRCRRVGELANSRRAAETTLLLHHPILLETEQTVTAVARALTKVCSHLST